MHVSEDAEVAEAGPRCIRGGIHQLPVADGAKMWHSKRAVTGNEAPMTVTLETEAGPRLGSTARTDAVKRNCGGDAPAKRGISVPSLCSRESDAIPAS